MTSPDAVVDAVLERLPPGVEAEVVASSSRSGLTRFANSFIHQNVADESVDVSLTLVDGERRATTAQGQVTATPAALHEFVDDALTSLTVAPVRSDWPGVTPPVDIPEGPAIAPATAGAGPEDRARLVKDFVESGSGTRAAGYCETTAAEVAFGNTAGHRAGGVVSSAVLDGIHRTDDSAGSGHAASRDMAGLDGRAVGAMAAERAERGRLPHDLPPGDYEVVLAPEAVATILLFLGLYGFNAKAVLEGQSFISLGSMQFDPSLTVVDDGTDARSMRPHFDREGTPKRRLDLVVDGVTTAVVHDRRQAAKAGVESTGHALSLYGQYVGPVPTDVFVSPGRMSPEQLVAGVERGLYVSTFNYVRILDPRTTVATGLTRNGTFLIEKGEIAGPVSNLRFTQSFAGALGPGRVLGIGSDARFADSEFGATLVHAPSLRLAGWRFTGGASG